MIRKPDAHDFRESGTVTTIRDVHAVAIEGARGVGRGTAQFFGRAVMVMFGFGFVMSVIGHAGPAGLLFAFAGIFAFFVLRRSRREKRDRAWRDVVATPSRIDIASVSAGSYDLAPAAAGRAAAKAAVPAILLFPTSAIGYMLPFAIGGILYLSLAMLIVARLVGDRTILKYDRESITVSGLLRQNTILWDDVADIEVCKSSVFNFKVLFSSGATRNLVVEGYRNRLGGSCALHIPVDLLGLGERELAALMSRLLYLQGQRRSTVSVAASDDVSPLDIAATSPVFDADEVMDRYLTERAAMTTAHRSGQMVTRPVFGRKRA
ncbi:hypothetical protein ASG11_04320 [Sphingomonas sp. Leaf357]|uniref:hypothetical protein n=1 Tax=Sphingomonas sp. Leaf357 TaxID=1736350 RepID=UPI0006FCD692|nr:hypothetical protein [Sphingomonas sp. Leaf357]KQS03574.1 hypothetical protein ASG11_04320 [Sphingomonas sp. Leaf357]